MNRQIVSATLMLVLLGGFHADATTLDFDSLAGSASPVPNGHGGLNWSNFYVVADSDLVFNGTHAVSPSNFVYGGCCGANDDIFVTSGTFDLISGYFGSADNIQSTVTVRGFLGATEIFNHVLAIDAISTLFVLNMTGVDRVNFDTFFFDNLVFDNLNVNVPSIPEASVPEPASMLLLGSGLVLLAVRRMKQKA